MLLWVENCLILSQLLPISANFCCFLLFFCCFLLFFCCFCFSCLFFHRFYSIFSVLFTIIPDATYRLCSPFKYLILHLCTNFSCIATLCTLYCHVFILAELQSGCLFVHRFFLNLMLTSMKNAILIVFLPQNRDFFEFWGVFCCFSRVFLFHVKLFCNNRLGAREVVKGDKNTV